MLKQISLKLTWLVLLLFFTASQQANKGIKHHIKVTHPGLEGAAYNDLIELRGEEGETLGYYMDVVSVYCEANVCRVDTVRLFWDLIGRYNQFSLPAGVSLEKNGGDGFTQADYELLHQILINKNARFKTLSLSELIKKNNADNEHDLDGYSGATIIKFSETESVKGAALSCYALWHWANNAVCDTMPLLTASNSDNKLLLEYLASSDRDLQLFAIKQMTKRELNNASAAEAILNALCQSNSLYTSGESFLLQAGSVYDQQVAAHIIKTSNYQHLNLLLNVLEQYNSNAGIENCMSLLDGDIIIARRAYYYLTNQKLDKK